MYIQNPDAAAAIRAAAGLTVAEGVPSNLSTTVTPVMDMTPRFHRYTSLIKSANRSTTTASSVTVFTTASDHDTYITAMSIALIKDSTCDVGTGTFNLILTPPDGVSINPLRIPLLTLTAQETTQFLSLPHPIKVKRGTTLSHGAFAFTVGNASLTVCFFGYEVYPTTT